MTDRPIPIEEDMHLQRATWTVERIGWLLLALIVVAGLCGIFSDGYLSAASVGEGDFRARYDRFQRKTVTTRIRADLPVGDDNEARLRIGKSVLEDYDIDSVDPRPARAVADGDDLAFDFGADGAHDFTVFFTLRPRRAGATGLRLTAPNRPPLILRAFIYP